MQFLSSDAILLDVRELHEHDRIVTYLSRDAGKRRGVARGSKRKYSRFAGQLQPLARCRVSWFERPRSELTRITDVEWIRSPGRLQADLEGILLGSYLADHTDAFAPEGEVNDPLYRLLESTLEGLENGVDRELATRYFETWVLRLAGIFPPPERCPQCGRRLGAEAWLAPSGEGIVCGTCDIGEVSGKPVATAALEFLRGSAHRGLAQMASEVPAARDPVALSAVEAVCRTVRRGFLQHELKSYEVMQKTLATVAT
ncbi:MAG: DNA repair protein RecO [Thermoanaerobaculia bacterium]